MLSCEKSYLQEEAAIWHRVTKKPKPHFVSRAQRKMKVLLIPWKCFHRFLAIIPWPFISVTGIKGSGPSCWPLLTASLLLLLLLLMRKICLLILLRVGTCLCFVMSLLLGAPITRFEGQRGAESCRISPLRLGLFTCGVSSFLLFFLLPFLSHSPPPSCSAGTRSEHKCITSSTSTSVVEVTNQQVYILLTPD